MLVFSGLGSAAFRAVRRASTPGHRPGRAGDRRMERRRPRRIAAGDPGHARRSLAGDGPGWRWGSRPRSPSRSVCRSRLACPGSMPGRDAALGLGAERRLFCGCHATGQPDRAASRISACSSVRRNLVCCGPRWLSPLLGDMLSGFIFRPDHPARTDRRLGCGDRLRAGLRCSRCVEPRRL